MIEGVSNFIELAHSVKGKKLSLETITDMFSKVPKNEYVQGDKEALISHLFALSQKKAK